MESPDQRDKEASARETGSGPASNCLVRVLVVEDESEARERLCAAVQRNVRLRLAGAADRLATARRWLVDGRHQLDVLMVDLGLPDGSGLDLIAECRQLRPDVSIMVMTMFSDERHVFAALERGASGYLLKSTPPEAIGEHVLELHAGGSPITPTVARLVLKRMSTPGNAPGVSSPNVPPPGDTSSTLVERLSAREVDVLNQIAVGYSTAEIASRLSISVHTVTAHIRRVYQKLQVHSRSAAVFEGQRHGLLATPQR